MVTICYTIYVAMGNLHLSEKEEEMTGMVSRFHRIMCHMSLESY